ncbi:hypothetical protein K378_04023 [Streptomyces sp. Amel2xB2]|nr:hypothetical protein K378_04023 [Streptomyces sp. Amel2xB2]
MAVEMRATRSGGASGFGDVDAHLCQNEGPESVVAGSAGAAHGSDVVPLSRGAQSCVVGHPAGQMRYPGRQCVQADADLVCVSAGAQEAGDQGEIAARLLQESGAPELVVERTERVDSLLDRRDHGVGDSISVEGGRERRGSIGPTRCKPCQGDAGDGKKPPTVHAATPHRISQCLDSAGLCPGGSEPGDFPHREPLRPSLRLNPFVRHAQQVGENALRIGVRLLALLPFPHGGSVGRQGGAHFLPTCLHESGQLGLCPSARLPDEGQWMHC